MLGYFRGTWFVSIGIQRGRDPGKWPVGKLNTQRTRLPCQSKLIFFDLAERSTLRVWYGWFLRRRDNEWLSNKYILVHCMVWYRKKRGCRRRRVDNAYHPDHVTFHYCLLRASAKIIQWLMRGWLSAYRFSSLLFLRRSFCSNTMAARTYQDAISLLNTLQTNAAALEAVRAAGSRLNPNAIPEMIEFLERIEYTVPFVLMFISPILICSRLVRRPE